jgi:hypothetical protein
VTADKFFESGKVQISGNENISNLQKLRRDSIWGMLATIQFRR